MSGGKTKAEPGRAGLAIRGALLTPLAAGGTSFEPDGLVVIDQDGRIRHAGRASRVRHDGPLIDVRPDLVVPGFVDTHTHFPQTRIIGCATGPLLDWLEQSVFPEEARFRRRAYASEVADELVGRLCLAGTTTVATYSSSSPLATDVAFEAFANAGLRAVVGLTWMEERCPEALRIGTDEALAASRKLVRKWHEHDGGRLRFAVTPRFALSCSRRMLKAAGDLAREHDLIVQTHVAENEREGEATLAAHPYASSYLDVYDQAGLLGERTILAHAIHLDRRDWSRIADAGTAIAHCPDSNFFLGSGRMKLDPSRRRGIAVGLGSDVAAGRSFSIRRAMASAYDNALAAGSTVEPAELLRLATLGGARTLGCDRVTGSLEPGKDADLIVIPMRRAVKTLDAALAALIFDNDDVRVTASFVRGKQLV
ncbi:MAG: guanine deaminase [Deltaproteobacteria bacterium]|nr:guanine deaminase [Deltaproteobacteria bacterium]